MKPEKMAKIKELIRVWAPEAWIKEQKISQGRPGAKMEKFSIGVEISIGEGFTSRADAMNLFEALRAAFPDFHSCSFQEENDLEWIWTLSFQWLAGGAE